MPFTISHTAAAWPFEKSKLVLSAVIVGAMAPDFDNFLGLDFPGRWSHSLAGTFEFSLPAALVVLAVFHYMLKRPAVALLPARVQQRIRIQRFKFWPFKRLMLIIGSVLVGIATHLAWDSFTHSEGWVVQHAAWMRAPHMILGHSWPIYKFAQHGSTVLGLVLLWFWFRAWYRQAEARDVEPRLTLRARTLIVSSMIATAFAVGLATAWSVAGPDPLRVAFVATDVVNFICVTTVELLVFSLALHVWEE
jgi:Domain of unknown function (DUF4184)